MPIPSNNDHAIIIRQGGMPIPRTWLLAYDRPFLLVEDHFGQLLLEGLGRALLFTDGVDWV